MIEIDLQLIIDHQHVRKTKMLVKPKFRLVQGLPLGHKKVSRNRRVIYLIEGQLNPLFQIQRNKERKNVKNSKNVNRPREMVCYIFILGFYYSIFITLNYNIRHIK